MTTEMPTGPWKRTSSGAFLWLTDSPKSVRPNMLAFEAVCGFEETGRQGSKPHTVSYLRVLERTHVYSAHSFINSAVLALSGCLTLCEKLGSHRFFF